MNFIGFIDQSLNFIRGILDLLNSIQTVIVLILLILIFHILLQLFRDHRYIKAFNSFKDPESLRIEDLKSLPLINILIPAWKEGEIFRQCLTSITKLDYPNLKVIVNAGGNEKTLNIVNSFQKYDNFKILVQKGGSSRASIGKIKALNECLEYIKEGIVYFIDADGYLNEEILLNMIFPLINKGEYLVSGGVRPLRNQENLDIVKYLQFNRNANFRFKFTRYAYRTVFAGANTCLKTEVIKSVKIFSENKKYATDASIGEDIFSQGFKSYRLNNYQHRIYIDFPSTFRELAHQTTVWTENRLIFSYKNKKILTLIKIFLLFFVSFYLLIFPFLIFTNFGLFLIGVMIFFNIYLTKIRKFVFFKLTINKQHNVKYSKVFFIKLLYYIYIEVIINFIIPFHFIAYLKKIKKVK